MSVCSKCGQETGDSKYCPYCGEPVANETRKNTCPECGAQLDEGSRFCPVCGAAADTSSSAPKSNADQTSEPYTAPDTENETPDAVSASNVYSSYTQNAGANMNMNDPQDIKQNKIMAFLSYLGILVLVPILAAKNSPFARFHANQGLILLLISAVWKIASAIIGAVLSMFMDASTLLGILNSAVRIFILVLSVMGIINVFNERTQELPLVGKFHLMK